MNKELKKPELLSPAGNLRKLKIALEYGADAVYGGVSHFSLRNRSGKEFDFESFKEGIEYTHNRGKKIYVTINGFPFNSQIKLLEKHIQKMAELNPDGFIVAAPGVVKLAQEIAPQIPIHLSTQANVLNVLDAKVFYEMGVKRIVAARELSLRDAIEIKKALPDLRVPNRGSCANDCRFDYEYYVRNPDNGVMMRLVEEEGIGTHIFNSKDLKLIEHLPMILESGVIDSLKIEGRTKSSYYAGITALAYRGAIDGYFKGDFRLQEYEKELETLKNRGFSDGYLIHRPYEKNNTQNHFTAISEGSYQVNAEVSEDGKFALCRHTIRVGESKEIVSSHNKEINEGKNELGEIYTNGDKKFMRFDKILLENGKELESIHSGNENRIVLPLSLPPFSFLRQKI